ncbi:MAG: hypothetical protein U0745_04490 [Polyangia bacterium]
MKLDVNKFQADMQAARERIEKDKAEGKGRADWNARRAHQRLQGATQFD